MKCCLFLHKLIKKISPTCVYVVVSKRQTTRACKHKEKKFQLRQAERTYEDLFVTKHSFKPRDSRSSSNEDG